MLVIGHWSLGFGHSVWLARPDSHRDRATYEVAVLLIELRARLKCGIESAECGVTELYRPRLLRIPRSTFRTRNGGRQRTCTPIDSSIALVSNEARHACPVCLPINGRADWSCTSTEWYPTGLEPVASAVAPQRDRKYGLRSDNRLLKTGQARLCSSSYGAANFAASAEIW